MVFMDVNMPGRNGLETTRLIHGLGGALAALPVIGLTANIMEDFVHKCYDAGMIAHVPKPFSAKSLYEAVALAAGDAQAEVDAAPAPAAQKSMRDTLVAVRDGMGGDYMRGMVASNSKEARRLLELFEQEKSKGRLDRMSDAAHDLKSITGLIGMNESSALAARLEEAGLRNDAQGLDNTFRTLRDTLEQEIREAERLANSLPEA
jgi:HPt (histidine-containing phosphotransfer) domain-containing protein